MLGLPAVHAGQHVLPRVGEAVPHQEVPVHLQEPLSIPPAHLPVVPGLPAELLLRGGDGGFPCGGAGPLVLDGGSGATPCDALVELQGILEWSCGVQGLWG